MIDRTPFGQGHPYTLSQITQLMRDNMFTPSENSFALFVPPTTRRVLIHSAPAWEKVGTQLFPHLGGVVLVEADNRTRIHPTPVTHAAGKDPVFVGRLRRDLSHPRGISMWVVSDNVRKGAALNAVQIMDRLEALRLAGGNALGAAVHSAQAAG